MAKRETAAAVLFGVFAFVIVASRSLFVVGEATGGITPGFHPTTEGELVLDEPIIVEPQHAATATAGTPRHVEPTVPRPARTATVATPASGIPAGYVYWKTIRAKVTAYDPSSVSCGKFADGKTSIGRNAWKLNGVATYPTAIPYGTYVVIPGVGGRTVDDTGSAMRNSWRRHRRFHIDLRVTYPYQARRWGVKNLDVKLYRKAR